MEATIRNILYSEPSCSNCAHGQLECTPAYWENPEEYNIECAYPALGNLGIDRDVVNDSFHHDCIDYAIDCQKYKRHQTIT